MSVHTAPTVQLRARRRGPVALLVTAVVVIAVALGTAFLVRGTGSTSSMTVGADESATSVLVYDRTQNRILRAEGPAVRFRSASLVKVLIALDLVQRGKVTSERPSPRIARMLAASDDAIASALWQSGGGPDIVRRVVQSLRLTATEPPADSSRWGDTLLSASDMVTVYQAVLALPDGQRRLILDPLRDAERVAADGTDQFFGIPDALPGMPRAIKQGWAAGRGGVDVHTSGVVGNGDRYIVVVLSHRPGGTPAHTAMAEVTVATAAVRSLLT
ncbi:hypothetical protein [Amycolatopsis viridis]|uniref:Beta-lactamase class A n=1 Tax=Amycolatopsis viridis TaxID=185678 RepID=A0ABX0SWD5_9PSEU|nr:hypothetical protein [Amycolatopsis viridis]NIH79979.1 hypothetical protein [Amycolatopsis viridis]